MAQNTKPAPVRERVGGQLGGASPRPFTLPAYRAQLIAARFSVSPELAAMLAALAFGEAHHG